MAVLRHISRITLINNFKSESRLHINYPCGTCLRFLNYSAMEYDESKNPAPLFFDRTVQSLLKSLTRIDLAKVFRKRKLGGYKLEDPQYKFMTDEELQTSIKDAQERANKMLQIPPAVPKRTTTNRMFSSDPALEGLETCRMVFTDITFGIKNNERVIVVREPDGTLQEADWELRDRMNQLYFPRKGRHITPPRMFEDGYLKKLLDRHEYEFILDRACIQFEPDDPKYQHVVSITYQYINDNNDFDVLRSTRHFGALTFFLVWNKNIDNLLLDLIETLHVEEGHDLTKLYFKVHNVSLSSSSNLEAIEEYIEKYSNKKPPLQLAVQAYKDLIKQKEQLATGIQAAHGV
ncbi:28S ribosomal protein S22, mitochondrial [Anoplophora glabripennis]|uniref:28S ribosomal protein S22, mitochondrial n=1 Tax=Anoplophora glabripennis TaxID=217634 RepID=UPI000875677E|nr:28S ribosomal protein S22, mitochondrial [Anoplophora glabripennis]